MIWYLIESNDVINLNLLVISLSYIIWDLKKVKLMKKFI